MSNQVVTRTLKASITNNSQLRDDLDSHGFAASKLWNVGRWTIQRVWNAVDHIPDADDLCSYLNSDLNAAENMRATVTPSPAKDRSTGCLAQPPVRLFDKSTGRVRPQEQVVP